MTVGFLVTDLYMGHRGWIDNCEVRDARGMHENYSVIITMNIQGSPVASL